MKGPEATVLAGAAMLAAFGVLGSMNQDPIAPACLLGLGALSWWSWTRQRSPLAAAALGATGVVLGLAWNGGPILTISAIIGFLSMLAGLSARGWTSKRAWLAGLPFLAAGLLMGPSGAGGGMLAALIRWGMSPEAAEAALFIFRKGVHVFGYAFLAFCASAALPRAAANRMTGAAAWTLCFAAADETVQSLYPAERTGQFTDVLFDAAGIALGLSALHVWLKRRRA